MGWVKWNGHHDCKKPDVHNETPPVGSQWKCGRCGQLWEVRDTPDWVDWRRVTELHRKVRPADDSVSLMTGAYLIAQERKRQIEMWTEGHDDEHVENDLSCAAAAYLLNNPGEWPWDRESFKPSTDRVRDLMKAGALIAAEIDRLQRRLHNAQALAHDDLVY